MAKGFPWARWDAEEWKDFWERLDDPYHCNQPDGRMSYTKVSGSCSVPAQISVISLSNSLYFSFTYKLAAPHTDPSYDDSNRIFDYILTSSYKCKNWHLKSSMVEDKNMITSQTSQQACFSLLTKAETRLLVRFAPLTASKYTWEQMYIVLYILYFAGLMNLSLAIKSVAPRNHTICESMFVEVPVEINQTYLVFSFLV